MEKGLLNLDDITAKEYELHQMYSIELHNLKAKREEDAKRIQAMKDKFETPQKRGR
jgi:hypothetical protein